MPGPPMPDPKDTVKEETEYLVEVIV
jgi:hypothetical protein